LFRALRLLRVSFVLSSYFILLAPIGYAGFAIWAMIPMRDARWKARKLQWVMSTAFGTMHKILRWMRILHFDPREVDGEFPTEPCVLVANHPTLVDISSLLATQSNLVFPVKSSMFRTFWARPLLEAADHFEASASDPFSVGKVVDKGVERLQQGYRVLIFPEGTRSPLGDLHPFGRTAFEIAVRQNVPVVPVVITCKPHWLSRERSFFNPPSEVPRLRIRVLDPIFPEAEGSSSRALRDTVSERIKTAITEFSQNDTNKGADDRIT
jgi:1-acyl-sn-glycerol-3-phosphate acyltransferase